jgi:hypothetical protein
MSQDQEAAAAVGRAGETAALALQLHAQTVMADANWQPGIVPVSNTVHNQSTVYNQSTLPS